MSENHTAIATCLWERGDIVAHFGHAGFSQTATCNYEDYKQQWRIIELCLSPSTCRFVAAKLWSLNTCGYACQFEGVRPLLSSLFGVNTKKQRKDLSVFSNSLRQNKMYRPAWYINVCLPSAWSRESSFKVTGNLSYQALIYSWTFTLCMSQIHKTTSRANKKTTSSKMLKCQICQVTSSLRACSRLWRLYVGLYIVTAEQGGTLHSLCLACLTLRARSHELQHSTQPSPTANMPREGQGEGKKKKKKIEGAEEKVRCLQGLFLNFPTACFNSSCPSPRPTQKQKRGRKLSVQGKWGSL